MITQELGFIVSCGAFNPITNAHLAMLDLSRDCVEYDIGIPVVQGIISPVNDSYKKSTLIKAKHRIKMCELAVSSTERSWINVDIWESTQAEYVRSIRVLERIRTAAAQQLSDNHKHYYKLWCDAKRADYDDTKEIPDIDGIRFVPSVFLCCGTDMFASMAKPGVWIPHQLKALLSSFSLLVLQRPGTGKAFLSARLDLAKQDYPIDNVFGVVPGVSFHISSTEVRKRSMQRRSLRSIVPKSVEEYIYKNELYSNGDSEKEHVEEHVFEKKEKSRHECKILLNVFHSLSVSVKDGDESSISHLFK
ncbi:hypothetical protein ADUPG1_007748 [Aduncisulcus paluster]|uniref:Cytidyltransferase-like domain-containing protein n=1 Tax=Aduncisulcus paluster TaxID=2918883 RepID=A0ABQ5KPF1_9EUKA|nr:hypothetical protein ADUPG1_007748 [Aduncisulcus paluster]